MSAAFAGMGGAYFNAGHEPDSSEREPGDVPEEGAPEAPTDDGSKTGEVPPSPEGDSD